MTLARTKLADIAYLPSVAGSIYANPASTKSYLRALTLFNGNTTAETIKLYNVPNSSGALGTAGVSSQFYEYSMLPKETLLIDFGYPVVLTGTNDSIQAITTTASKVTVMLHGDTE